MVLLFGLVVFIVHIVEKDLGYDGMVKKDCIYAILKGEGKGSQYSITLHYRCIMKNIAITEPIENTFIKVPLKPIGCLGFGYEEFGWWIWKEIKITPIMEYEHPCDNCQLYEGRK